MSFPETNFDDNLSDDGQLPEESNNNRTFLIAAGILGGIILISMACLVGVFLFNQNNKAQVESQNAAITQTVQANNNFINNALTATANAVILPTATQPPTATAVVALATATSTLDPNITPASGTVVAGGTPAAATATVGAALTQAAVAQLTIVPTTTALPNTGFADEVGIPGLLLMALAFIIVILMARRLRFATTR
ncbi:MAG: hypothetical protein HXY38_06320 [Chloroflexi bacterium]|nr:hypothetical protein [Chloroflexota bacterium]